MNSIINNAFKYRNGATRYTHIKVGRNKSYFTSDPLNGDNKYTANDICKMVEFLVDNIYVRFGGQLFRQMVGIPMGTNCAPLLPDSFLYSYENEFLDKLVKEGKRKLARKFNLSYHYIDDTGRIFVLLDSHSYNLSPPPPLPSWSYWQAISRFCHGVKPMRKISCNTNFFSNIDLHVT